jgi:hypothetical protein
VAGVEVGVQAAMVVWRLQCNGRAVTKRARTRVRSRDAYSTLRYRYVTRQGMHPSGPTTTQAEHVADNMLHRNRHVSVDERA